MLFFFFNVSFISIKPLEKGGKAENGTGYFLDFHKMRLIPCLIGLIQRKKGKNPWGFVNQDKSHHAATDSYMTRSFFCMIHILHTQGGLHF